MAGAVERTRTSTGCPASTSSYCVYQSRHDRRRNEREPWGLASKALDVTNQLSRNKGHDLRSGAGGARSNIDPYLLAKGRFLHLCRHLAFHSCGRLETPFIGCGTADSASGTRRDGCTSSGYNHMVVS